jgi:hypothetical protein
MTTPTKLDPRVFERAAEHVLREDLGCCAALMEEVGDYAICVRYRNFLESLFMPSDSVTGFWWAPPGELISAKFARAIALDLCALILKEEQRKAKHAKS